MSQSSFVRIKGFLRKFHVEPQKELATAALDAILDSAEKEGGDTLRAFIADCFDPLTSEGDNVIEWYFSPLSWEEFKMELDAA